MQQLSCKLLVNPHLRLVCLFPGSPPIPSGTLFDFGCSDHLDDLKWEPSALHDLGRQKNYETFNFMEEEYLISSATGLGGVMINGKDKKPVGRGSFLRASFVSPLMYGVQ